MLIDTCDVGTTHALQLKELLERVMAVNRHRAELTVVSFSEPNDIHAERPCDCFYRREDMPLAASHHIKSIGEKTVSEST
jgi:hypothetical protein